jgi:hypothetical protein
MTLKISFLKIIVLSTLLGLLIGCSRHDPSTDVDPDAQMKENNARATGSACREAGRALEDCYILNPTMERSLIFSGWKEMNDYMRENKMENVKPALDAGKVTASVGASAAEVKDKKQE